MRDDIRKKNDSGGIASVRCYIMCHCHNDNYDGCIASLRYYCKNNVAAEILEVTKKAKVPQQASLSEFQGIRSIFRADTGTRAS